MSIRLLDNPMNGAIVAKAFSFTLAFLHTSEIWSSKFSFQSSLTPNNFSHLLFSVSYSPTWTITFSLPLISKWHLSVLLFKRLLSNHWNKAVEASSNDLIRSSILSAITYGVLWYNRALYGVLYRIMGDYMV